MNALTKMALRNFHTFNKFPMHKQQKRVLNHLQILRIAVGFSGKSHKIVTQKSVHPINSVGVCFAYEMFRWINKFVGMPMVQCINFCVDMTNFIRKFLEVFCFSSAELKVDKALCGAVYCGPEPDIFLNLGSALVEHL